MIRTIRMAVLGCTMLSFAGAAAHAEPLMSTTFEAAAAAQLAAPPAAAQTPAAEPATTGRLNAGAWGLNFYGGAYTTFSSQSGTIYFGTAELEYFLWDKLSVNVDLVGWGINQDIEDGEGIGFNLLARWHFFTCAQDRVALYAEGGAGLSEWNTRVPDPAGTHFNFTLHAGLGVKWQITENVGLMGGGRYLHISNADTQGDNRNPGLDAVGGYAGLVIRF